MISPEWRRMKAVKTLAGSGSACQKECEPHWSARPNGDCSLMLTNKDPSNARAVKIEFGDSNGKTAARFSGPVTMVTFGAGQYVWQAEGPKSRGDPDGPPRTSKINAKGDSAFTLPKASVTVLRGKTTAD
jgi:hypothetical protein